RRTTCAAHGTNRPAPPHALFHDYPGAKATGVLSALSLRKSFIPSRPEMSSPLWRSVLEALVAPVPVRSTAVRIPWPFDRVREGQTAFLADARKAIEGGGHPMNAARAGARPG